MSCREPDIDAFNEQRGKGQGFGVPPVNTAALPHRFASALELLGEPGVHVQCLGPRQQALVQRDEQLGAHRRWALRHIDRFFILGLVRWRCLAVGVRFFKTAAARPSPPLSRPLRAHPLG